MSQFICKIGMPDGRLVQQQFQARSRAVLRAELEQQGCRVFAMRRVWVRTRLLSRGGPRRWEKEQFLLFNQEFLALVKAGMPILYIFDAVLQEGWDRETVQVLTSVRSAVAGGSALAEAFAQHPRYFPSLYCSIIRAGEQTGDLPIVLERFISYQKHIRHLRERLRSAAIYPSLLILASAGVLAFLLLYVIPTFTQIYADAQVVLPPVTRALMALAGLLGRIWPLLLLALALAPFGLRRALQRPRWRLRLDGWLLRLPGLGPLLQEVGLVNYCQTLSTVLNSGMPLLPATELACGVLNNRVLEQRLRGVLREISGGGSLAEALQQSGVIPSLAVRMVATGEKTGSLSSMLGEVAEFYQATVENRLGRLAGFAEPAMMIVVGLLIGVIVVAIYLPIFQLAGTVR